MSREPGFFERQYICRNVNRYYTNFNLVVKLNGEVTKPLLSHALKRMIDNHPWFLHNFYRIGSLKDDEINNGRNFEVKIVNVIRFEDVVEFKDIDGEMDANILEEVNLVTCPMNEPELPLWRIRVYESKNHGQFICLCCDHSLFDAVAGLEFQKELVQTLEACEDEVSGTLKTLKVLFDKKDIDPGHPDIEDAREKMLDLFQVPYSATLKSYLNNIPFWKSASSYLSNYFTTNNRVDLNKNLIFRYNPTTANDIKAKYKILSFTTEELKNMLEFCKQKEITLTPYINILALQCLQETVFEEVKDDETEAFSTTSLVAVNGRRYYDLPNFLYGALAGSLGLTFGPMPAAQNKILTTDYMLEASYKLKKCVETRECFAERGLLKDLDYWKYFSSKLGTGGKSSLVVSNLGVVKDKPNSKWKIEDLWFGLNTGIMYQFVVNITSTERSGLKVVFCYTPDFDDLINDEGTKVIDNFIDVLAKRLVEFPKSSS